MSPTSPALLNAPFAPPVGRASRLRNQLLARIHRRYKTVTRELDFGHVRFPFTRIADPDRVLDEVAAEADRRERVSGQREAEPLHLPYWAELWDSATGMGQLLVRQQWIEGSRSAVMDLGCGMGLPGTVAAALGGRVLFADLEPPALLFARLNSLLFDSAGRRIRARRLNWQTDRLGERFNVILGADILYERKQWEFLEPFWREHLAPRGRVILGEPGRPTGDDFPAWVEGRGWRVTLFEETVATRPRPIRLFQIDPPAEARRNGHAGEAPLMPIRPS